jgi:hypothetical protein
MPKATLRPTLRWEQRVVLKHHADAALLGRQGHRGRADHAAFQRNRALAHRLQPGHGAQQRGLAAARRADEHADIAGLQIQGHAVDSRAGATGVTHAELGHLEEHG